MIRNLELLFFVAILSAGCAGGHSYDYSKVSLLPVGLDGHNNKVAVGVHDQRKYVANGDKYPQYVGTMRSPAYVPWNVNTRIGLPMADDFLAAIKHGLEADRFTVNPVVLSAKESRQDAIERLKKTGDYRLLLFTINEWYFDVWGKTRMEYDLQLDVLDTDGNNLATAQVGKKIWEDNDNTIPDVEFRTAAEKLLSTDAIVKSLDPGYKKASQPATLSVPVEKEKAQAATQPIKIGKQISTDRMDKKMTCTAEQILKMKAMGMADSQIKAACR